MQPRGFLIVPLLAIALLPIAAAAQDRPDCEALQRRLGNSPQVIGNTAEVRYHAQELSRLNAEIRDLRIEMRRAGCGAGSIVSFGGPEDICSDMQNELGAMEADRQDITMRRNEARSLVRPTVDRSGVLAALQRNGCDVTEISALPKAAEPEQSGNAAIEPYSGITNLRTLAPAQPSEPAKSAELKPEPPPERPYDRNQKVRSVGPQFFPEENDIDLANPASPGPQPMQ